jgi:methionine-rich copper-binding protein CopC
MQVQAFVAVLTVLAATSLAHAHAHLVRSSPADHATISPDKAVEVRLTFSEPVEPKFSGATVTAGGAEAARAAKAGSSRSEIVVPLNAPLVPGRYEVRWHAVSADTHKTEGVFSFEVKP